MPPKKRKRKPTQSQSQRQSVVINIGSKTSKPRKKSGRGGLPPPSYQHNLAPTFITAPQVDYTPLLAMMQHHARPIVEQAPMPITQTPLSASVQASNAEQMAGEAAIRRAGPTAANFQPPPSQSRDKSPILTLLNRPRPETSKPKTNLKERFSMGAEDKDAPQQALRPPDPYVTQQLVPTKSAEDLGAPVAEARFVGQPSAIQAEVALPKTPARQKQQTAEKRDIKDIIDQKLKSGEPLTQKEMSKAMLKSSQIGDKRKKALIEAGYTQFE
jgi:hypothetical protein